MNRTASALLLASSLATFTLDADAIVITTNMGDGADAEVRESNPDQNRGSSTEIATRVIDRFDPVASGSSDPNDRNSVIYLQFDLSSLGPGDAAGAILRMTYRNNNLQQDRVTDTDGTGTDHGQNGLEFYGIAGQRFDENLITYNNAPGMTPDSDVGTRDFNLSATFLGDVDFPPVNDPDPTAHLPVGDALDFVDIALTAFLEQEILNNPFSVAVIAVVHRNLGLVPDAGNPAVTKSGDEPVDWSNFNYLFNPKEQTTLNTDPGSPWSGADNSTGTFSPQLILPSAEVSAPATLVLLAMAFAGVAMRRRHGGGGRSCSA